MKQKDPQFLRSMILDGRGKGRTIDAAAVNDWSSDQGILWVHLDVADPQASGLLVRPFDGLVYGGLLVGSLGEQLGRGLQAAHPEEGCRLVGWWKDWREPYIPIEII